MKNWREREDVVRDFADVINCHSLENRSNTPDFILAEYLMDALEAYERIHKANERWYGKKLEIGGGTADEGEKVEIVLDGKAIATVSIRGE